MGSGGSSPWESPASVSPPLRARSRHRSKRWWSHAPSRASPAPCSCRARWPSSSTRSPSQSAGRRSAAGRRGAPSPACSGPRSREGGGTPAVLLPLIGGIVLLGCFLAHEARAEDPMLPLGLFRRRNFSAGNIETFSMYAGLSILFLLLILFLQQIG